MKLFRQKQRKHLAGNQSGLEIHKEIHFIPQCGCELCILHDKCLYIFTIHIVSIFCNMNMNIAICMVNISLFFNNVNCSFCIKMSLYMDMNCVFCTINFSIYSQFTSIYRDICLAKCPIHIHIWRIKKYWPYKSWNSYWRIWKSFVIKIRNSDQFWRINKYRQYKMCKSNAYYRHFYDTKFTIPIRLLKNSWSYLEIFVTQNIFHTIFTIPMHIK